MPTASYNKYTAAVEAMLEGDNIGSAVWKIALSNTINPADASFVAGTTDLVTGNGYTQGGNTAATSSATQSGGVYKLVLADPAIWTASGAGFTIRYVILYNSTTGVPYGYWDYGSSQTINSGETFTVDLDAVNGVFSVT